MSQYILVLVWLGIAGVLSMRLPMQEVRVKGKIEYRYQFWWALIIMVPIIFWAGTRGYVGDTYNYAKGFRGMPEQLQEIGQYMNGITKDKGFYFFSALIKVFISTDTTVYFLILAAIQGIILVKLYRTYSVSYVTSIFLFIASTDYISWMYNGIRQFMAVTITLLTFKWVLGKKYIQAVLLIFLASLFHQSALLLLPFIFICQGQAWNKRTIFFIVFTIAAVVGIEQFTNILDTVLSETQYQNVVTDWKLFEDDGTNLLRVLVYAVPAIIAFVCRKEIEREDNQIINYCVNMSIVTAGIYIISNFTSGIFIGRLPIYFSLYNYILLPWEIENLFVRQSEIFIKICMIIAYLIFYYYSIHYIWNLL